MVNKFYSLSFNPETNSTDILFSTSPLEQGQVIGSMEVDPNAVDSREDYMTISLIK